MPGTTITIQVIGQAASANQALDQVNSRLNQTRAAGNAAVGAYKQIGDATKGTTASLQALGRVTTLIGYQTFPAATAAAQSMVGVLQNLNVATRAAGVAFGPVAVAVAGLTAVVATATAGWKAYAAAQEEASSADRLAFQTGDIRRRLRELMADLVETGKLSKESAAAYRQFLDEAAGTPRERGANLFVNQQLRGIVGVQSEIDAREKLRKLEHEMLLERLEGFDAERLKAFDTYAERIKQIEELAKAQKKTLADPEIQRAKDIADEALAANLDKARQNAEEAKRRQAETVRAFASEIELSAARAAEGELAFLDKLEFARRQDVNRQITDFEEAERLKTLITQEFAARRREIELEEARKAQADREREQEALRRLRSEQLRATSEMFGNMAAAARAFGREGFAAYKAFAIAQATVSTAVSAIEAYRAVVGIPYVGPILAPIAAAAAVAAGVAQIATIASQSFAKGGFTGMGPRDEAAGVVHRGEFVFNAPAVDRIGVPTLEALQSGSITATGGEAPASKVNQNLHVYVDKQLWLDAVRDDVEGIALDALRRSV
jgi:hypothetical protein